MDHFTELILSVSTVASSGVAAASCDLASVTAARALVTAVVRTKTIQRIFPETNVHFTETKLHPMAALKRHFPILSLPPWTMTKQQPQPSTGPGALLLVCKKAKVFRCYVVGIT